MAAVLYQLEREKAPKRVSKASAAEEHNVSPKAPAAEEQDAMDLNRFQELWETAVTSRAEEKTESKEPQEKEGTHGTETGAAVTKKRGRKSKAQLEAERIAAEEAAKQAKKEETERRIAERKALKSAQKAERKRKRQEAEEAQKRARAEEAARKEEDQRRQQEEAQHRELEEKKRREAEAAQRREQEQQAMKKKEEKVKAAIARKNKEEVQVPEAPHYQYFDIDSIRRSLDIAPNVMEKGKEYLLSKKLVVENIDVGYFEQMDDMAAHVHANAEIRGHWSPAGNGQNLSCGGAGGARL